MVVVGPPIHHMIRNLRRPKLFVSELSPDSGLGDKPSQVLVSWSHVMKCWMWIFLLVFR